MVSAGSMVSVGKKGASGGAKEGKGKLNYFNVFLYYKNLFRRIHCCQFPVLQTHICFPVSTSTPFSPLCFPALIPGTLNIEIGKNFLRMSFSVPMDQGASLFLLSLLFRSSSLFCPPSAPSLNFLLLFFGGGKRRKVFTVPYSLNLMFFYPIFTFYIPAQKY